MVSLPITCLWWVLSNETWCTDVMWKTQNVWGDSLSPLMLLFYGLMPKNIPFLYGHHACECSKKKNRRQELRIKSVEYRDAIKSKETRQGWPSEHDAVVQWMMATYFELTSLAHVNFPPHKPYMVSVAPGLQGFFSPLSRPTFGNKSSPHCKDTICIS